MKKQKQCKAWVHRGRMGSGQCINAAVAKGLCRQHAKKLAAGKPVHTVARGAVTVSSW